MLTTPHVIVSLAIFKIYPHPLEAVLLSFLSHFILDFFIPHWNPHLYTEFKKQGKISLNSIIIILIDGFIALTLISFLSFKALPDISQVFWYLACAGAAVLPDLIEIPYYFLNWKNKILTQYVNFEHKNQAKSDGIIGILTQVLIIIASLKQIFA